MTPVDLGPVSADEIVYRRIPESYFVGERVSPQAFRPSDQDTTGLSLFRAKGITPEEVAAKGRAGKRYWIASLRVSDLQARGFDVKPDPSDQDGPSHALFPSLTAVTRDIPVKRVWEPLYALIVDEPVGPFPGMR